MGADRNFSEGAGDRAPDRGHGEREARAYNGCLRADLPAGSRGKAPGEGVRRRTCEASSLKLKALKRICTPKEGPKFCCHYANTVQIWHWAVSKQMQPSPMSHTGPFLLGRILTILIRRNDITPEAHAR